MSPRPIVDTIEVLRRTLMEVERDLDPVSDGAALSCLKRIVLNRIAELELLQAQQGRMAARSLRPLSLASSPRPRNSQMGNPAPELPEKP